MEKTMREKCIVSGCAIPARGKLKLTNVEMEFAVCGIHRRVVSEIMNECQEDLRRAHRKAYAKFIIALDELGNHDAERELALAE